MSTTYYLVMNLKFTKLRFYTKSLLKGLIPHSYLKYQLRTLIGSLKKLDKLDADYIKSRVDYYNKTELGFDFYFEEGSKTYYQYTIKGINSTYYFDFKEPIRYFDKNLRFHYLFGDINYTSKKPAFVKSRPITNDNQNSVVLKLDKLRHFYFVRDMLAFDKKKSCAVFRGPCYQPHRQEFINSTINIKNTDIGDTRSASEALINHKTYMTRKEQLKYKFIISVEGNDVATNLKWIMSSNSLCFMRRPRFETWFMEGKLIPNYHYVLLNDDYSNLEEVIGYYTRNTHAALAIIKNANTYTQQFSDLKREKLISLLVIYKYFKSSKQII